MFVLISLALCSFAYERICVLFNIAAQQSAIASAQNLETDDGLKMAAKLFQVNKIITFVLYNLSKMLY